MKFKVVPQLDDEECGAACVCTILENYFGISISLCEMRPIIKNTQAGTAFGDLKLGLDKLGIDSTIYKSEKLEESFSEMNYPIITQIKNDDRTFHYIVIYKYYKNKLYIADPDNMNPIKIKVENFLSSWNPYIIQVNLKSSKVKVKVDEDLNKLAYPSLLNKVKWKVMFIALLSVLVYIIGLVLSSMYNTYFNSVIPQKLYFVIFNIMSIYLFIILLKFIFNLLSTLITNSLNKKIDTTLSDEFFRKLFQKSPAALEYFGIGETITTLSNVVTIRQRFFASVVQIPLNIIWLVVSFLLLIKTNLNLSILVLILLLILTVTVYYSNDKYKYYSKKVLSSSKDFNETIIDIFSNTKMIKEYRQEKEFVNRGREELKKNISNENNLLNFDAKLGGFREAVLDSFNVALFSFGAYMIIRGDISTGSLLTYNSIVGFTISPLLNLTNVQALLTQAKTSQELLFNLLKSKLDLFGNESFVKLNTEPNISLNNLNFSFDGRKKLLNNVNIKIEKVDSVAITGANGTGKTTLGKLIARHYQPDSGYIKINDTDLNEFDDVELLKHVVFVDNSEGILSTSILDNILLGRNVNIQNIQEISKKIGLDEIIESKEGKYNTVIGKNGVKLSLGQEQLIKIARSTIEEKDIYVFDEITNGLDAANKDRVIKYLFNLPGLKFFITHDQMLVDRCKSEIHIESMNAKFKELS